jgi:hypothetical protein
MTKKLTTCSYFPRYFFPLGAIPWSVFSPFLFSLLLSPWLILAARPDLPQRQVPDAARVMAATRVQP